MGRNIAFGPFVLEPAAGTLLRHGEPVQIGYRALRLLTHFLEHPGQILSKTELIDAAWDGAAVEEGNLTVQVASLRKLLGKSPDGTDWLTTIPRVGYRFVGPLEPSRTDVSETPREGRSPIPSLAVLPFNNLSNELAQDYFADGIVDDLIIALSRFKTFAVISRNSSFSYKGRAADVREIGRELGVRYVLEGGIQRSGNRLRVTTHLVDASTAKHLWAKNYDGALEDVFDMQDRITESVVSIVEPMVKRAEIDRARRKPPASLDAYDLYLRAMALVLTTEPGASIRAIELIERSLQRDPNFPPAIAMAAIAYTSAYDRQVPGATEETRLKGLEYGRTALAIADGDANTRVTGGITVIMLGGEYASGMAAIRQATAENPNSINVLGFAGVGAFWASELDDAERYFLRAVALNPNDHAGQWILTRMAHICIMKGHFEEALDWGNRAYAVAPSNPITHSMLVAANAFLGRLDAAKQWLSLMLKASPEISFASIRRGHQMVRDQRQIELIIEGLRLAGMPEDGAR